MKNKYFLISLLIWLGTFKTYSQSCEIFANNDHEIISICNDTIAYRLKNNGGIETFSYSIGEVKTKRKKVKIFHAPFAFAYSESKAALKNVAIVILLDNDLNPIRNASIRTKINKEEMFLFLVTNKAK